MPIDIALPANTPTGALELRQVQAIPDGTAFAALLVVRSGGLAAALPYFVTRDAFREFVEALGDVVIGAATPARLPARDGSGMLVLGTASDGMMIVSGHLEEECDQLFRFRFVTDVRGAATLHEGLRSLLDESRS